ncbi:hypothetical protein [Pseudoruegeria sp. HB172150]|uniref:hypothetical protein n=1 Tax=Pseudoruegeria sp. HB172150 TaxID=2721164 RepID=UPI001557C6F0|nr:hypothetical protein [Pseudoruegeria sp. HB172150]
MRNRRGTPDWERLRYLPDRLRQTEQDLALDLAEERAAIMQYEGGLSRKEAEREAFEKHSPRP